MSIVNPPVYTQLNPIRAETFRRYLVPQDPNKHELLVHTVATIIIFGAIVTLALLMSNHLTTFPQDFIHAFSQPKAIIALCATAVGVIGGSVVIRNIVCDKVNGKFSGTDHWKAAYISSAKMTDSSIIEQASKVIQEKPNENPIQTIQKPLKLSDEEMVLLIDDLKNRGMTNFQLTTTREQLLEKQPFRYENQGYLDTSTADTGQCAFYTEKGSIDNEYVATAVIATAPIHVAATIANNILRMLVIPVKLAFTGKAHQIPAELKADVWRAVRAPFYGVAVIMAGLYMWVSPRNGEKLVAAVENKWNDGIPLHESGWAAPICNGCCSLLILNPIPIGKVAIDGIRKGLRGGGFYVAGCAQKRAFATLDSSNTITSVHGFPHFFIPGNDNPVDYTIYFRE